MANDQVSLSILQGSGSVYGDKSMQDVIYDRISQQYKDRIEKASEARKEVYDSKAKYYETQNEKLMLVSGGIKNAVDSISSAVDSAKKIKDMIFDLKVYLESADRDSTYYAQEFDKKLTAIYEEVQNANGAYNLLGAKSRTNYESNEYDLQIDDKGTTVTLQGYNMSSDYTVTDSSGKYWVADMYGGIKRYDNYSSGDLADETTYSTVQAAAAGSGSSTSKVITRTDTNYSSSTISFDVGGSSYTGTVSKGGLEIGQSWLYGRFSDVDGLAQATEDVNDALENAELIVAQLSAEKATTEGEYNALTNTIGENQSVMNSAMIAQMEEEYDFTLKMQTEYQGVITSIASIAQTQGQYGQIFGSIMGDNPLTNYMFDQTA